MKHHYCILFLVLSLLAACLSPNDSNSIDQVKYEVIFRDNKAGEYVKKKIEENTFFYNYHYTDRGRGPEIQEEITLNKSGFIFHQKVSGVNYLKDSLYEEFLVEGKMAKCNNPGGTTESQFPGDQLYFRYDGSPAIYEILGNLLIKSSDKKIELYPEGIAELVENTSITLDNGIDASLLMVKGLDMNPEYIWMEGSNLLGRISGNLHVIREDMISQRAKMKSIQDSLENDYLFELSRKLSHEYSSAVIKNVNVFTLNGKLLREKDVFVEGDKIMRIVNSGQQQVAQGILILDGTGKTLLPGMFDMHTHNNKFRGALHIAGGITSVRDLANNKKLNTLKQQFNNHEIIGPRIVFQCGIIDGPGPYANQRNVINNLEEGIAEIEDYKRLGYQQIKLYSSIKPEWVPQLTRKSHELGMKVSGHIPAFMTAEKAIDEGFDEIQHINMIFLNFLSDTIDTRTPLRFTMVANHGGDLDLNSQTFRGFTSKLKSKDIIVDPTVSIFENMFISRKGEPSPTYQMIMNRLPLMNQRNFLKGGLPKPEGKDVLFSQSFDKMLKVIFDLYEKGIRIVPGTDGLPGFLYHRELELYYKSGIPIEEVLKLATIKSAETAGVAESLGSIEKGKLADLILVDGNPLENISDIRKVEWTMKGGRIFYADEVYASMGIEHFK